jgi:sulfide:quinone oxidoreductase
MARIVILGAGIAGHTVARYLNKWVGKQHEVVVVSPNAKWNWIPSNIWVGVGQMKEEEVTFDLAEVYSKTRVDFRQAKALSINPEGNAEIPFPFVSVEYTSAAKTGVRENITYDFLVNATGPKLNFGATEGLGPEHGHTVSVCTASHALEANAKLQKIIDALKAGERKTIVIGTGHGMCTCQGAAFEYIYNVDHVLREAGVRDKARIVWLSKNTSWATSVWAVCISSAAAMSPTARPLRNR